MVKAVSNATVGTVIVLVHVALADRKRLPSGSESAAEPARLGYGGASQRRVAN